MPDGAALIRPTNRAVIIAGWRSAYPAYKPCRGHCRMALRLSGLQNCAVVIAGWRYAYPAYKPCRGYCRVVIRLPGLRNTPHCRESAFRRPDKASPPSGNTPMAPTLKILLCRLPVTEILIRHQQQLCPFWRFQPRHAHRQRRMALALRNMV